MNAGIEVLFWLIFGGAVLAVWLAYEITQAIVRHRRRQVIHESRYFQHGREIRARHDCWEIDGTRVR